MHRQRTQSIGGADGDIGGKIVAQRVDLVAATRSSPPADELISEPDTLNRSEQLILGGHYTTALYMRSSSSLYSVF